MSALAAAFVPAHARVREVALAIMRDPAIWAAYDEALWAATGADKERLKTAAMNAIKEFPRNWDGAKSALYKAVRNDATLLWSLFEPYRQVAVQKLLTEAASELREQELAKLPRIGAASREVVNNQCNTARRSTEGMKAASAVATQSLLDTFKVNGKPIGDLTPREANKWAAHRERDARFVRLLVQNLPPDEPIRRFRRGDDAQELYDRANAEMEE